MKNTNKGFTVVEALLAIVVLLLLGYIIFTAWTATNNKEESTKNPTSSQRASEKTDPYAGWKEYCSPTTNYCLKHPPTWNLQADVAGNEGGKGVTISSESNEVTVYYTPALDGKGGWVEPGTMYFTALTVKDVSGFDGVKIISGVLEDKSEPQTPFSSMWFVASQDSIDNYGIKLNERAEVGFFLPWINTTSQILQVNSGDKFTSLGEAEKWFDKTYVKQAGLVLESLRIK